VTASPSDALQAAAAGRVAALAQSRVLARIWARDPLVWSDDPAAPEIADRLGWLTVPTAMASEVASLGRFADEIRSDFDRVVLCGMGGSSLAAETLQRTFGSAPGYPALTVLDSTEPRAVATVARDGDIRRTLFLLSSKSGTTLEVDCLYRYFATLADNRGAQFVALTDPGTPLAGLARERSFRRTFLAPSDIGGRYSALSHFGLVPAALIGVDIARLLERARRMAEASGPEVPPRENPGALLGAALAEGCLTGHDKLTLILAPEIAGLGPWVEQLVAESTGKAGRGIVPVVDEPLTAPLVYGRDRLFVAVALGDAPDRATEARIGALEHHGHPVVRSVLRDPYDLGGEFFRWELATAVVGALLHINPFDQPNVAESKANTDAVLRGGPSPVAVTEAGAPELAALLRAVRPGDYIALMAYLPMSAGNDRRLAAIRRRLRDQHGVATTLGYGPRLLHSTGQLHKGGPPIGHFIQIVEQQGEDLAIPGRPYSFGQVARAQADGDLLALRRRGRPALRLAGLDLLERFVATASAR
jgi:glucose-6-phosphate isomerase